MTSQPIIACFDRLKQFGSHLWPPQAPKTRPTLRYWAQHQHQLPEYVRHSPVAVRYLQLLEPLAWEQFPDPQRQPNGQTQPVPHATLVGACLIKLDQQLVSMGRLCHFLVDHPALIWLLGFPLKGNSHTPWGFNAHQSLPTARHLTRLLRHLPNESCQFLLENTIDLIRAEVADLALDFGQTISMDTKHILAWVKENNPKAYCDGPRFDKSKQPKGDADCKLGCKRRRNQRASSKEPPPTPPDLPLPATIISVGEYYWGYASGVVVTRLPGWGEVVLAELTLPFDQPDVAYFFPLMHLTEQRLGFRPKYAAFDAAFDAFYIYEYFHSDDHDGFAAIPFVQHGGHKRTFDPDGLPLCQAGLAMPLKSTFWSKTGRIEHEKGRHACPLLFPEPTGQSCPIEHKQWPKGGCISVLPTCIGARLRYQLDRDSGRYKQLYNQRTATERINSQAVALGIERPRLRNQQAIANQNTLIYTLLNLRTLHRIRHLKTQLLADGQLPS
jgi:hypothetical protein